MGVRSRQARHIKVYKYGATERERCMGGKRKKEEEKDDEKERRERNTEIVTGIDY